MAEAGKAGTIRIRIGGLGEGWEEIITHELAHQLSSFNDDLAKKIIMNPGNTLGRYNIRLMKFDGMSYNPEESWADSVMYYLRYPNNLKSRFPEAYKAVQTYIDSYLKNHKGASVDYIHDEDGYDVNELYF